MNASEWRKCDPETIAIAARAGLVDYHKFPDLLVWDDWAAVPERTVVAK